jgi:hypothetical protein
MNNNKNHLVYLLKDSSALEIYVVNWKNKLIKISCPFFVYVLYSVGDLFQGQKLKVREIRVTSKLITVYVIGNQSYYYYHFDIIVE